MPIQAATQHTATCRFAVDYACPPMIARATLRAPQPYLYFIGYRIMVNWCWSFSSCRRLAIGMGPSRQGAKQDCGTGGSNEFTTVHKP